MNRLKGSCIAALAAALLISSGCTASVRNTSGAVGRAAPKTVSSPGRVASSVQASRFLTETAPIDDPKVEGIDIDEALRRIGRPVPLPRIGRDAVKKVVLRQGDPAHGEAPEFFALSLLYSTGVHLYVTPGHFDLDSFADLGSPDITFTDGTDGRTHARRETVSGKDVFTYVGGVQSGRALGWHVKTVANWNDGEYMYTLYAPAEDAAALGQLRAMIAATR
ncbi:MAG: hypothetical protein WC971_05805 [Coriobacteriia bacterium]